MKVVTSGSAYLDIDSYAGIIAYAELLKLQGEDVIAASSAAPNESVTATVRKNSHGLERYTPDPSRHDEFVLIDVSKEVAFDPIVQNGTVVEIIDHHPGFETYWQEKIGDKAVIEQIGAACTQVFERWEASGKSDGMKPGTAMMLAAGILDNTLNFNAGVTLQRDHDAYVRLAAIGNLPDDFAARYFSECQAAIEADLATALRNDTKDVKQEPLLPEYLGQLTVLDPQQLIADNRKVITEVMNSFSGDWAVNVIGIGDGKSYIISDSVSGRAKMTDLLGAEFADGVAVLDRLWLRKEFLKRALGKTAELTDNREMS